MVKKILSKIVKLVNRPIGSSLNIKFKSQKAQKISKSEKTDKAEQHKLSDQIDIERSKFSPFHSSLLRQETAPHEIPHAYNEDRIALQVRDPWWIHCYWEVSALTKDRLKESLGNEYYQASWTLRVYDVSYIIFNGFNAHRYFDISINADSNNWYINVASGCSFCVDLGLKLGDGRFILILRSNTVTTPIDQPSWIIDEEWMIPDEEFFKLYGFSPNASSPMGKGVRKKIGEHILSLGLISSPRK